MIDRYICLYFNMKFGYWDHRTYKDIKLGNELLTGSGKQAKVDFFFFFFQEALFLTAPWRI